MGWLSNREAFRKLFGLLFRNSFVFSFDEIPLQAKQLTWARKRNVLRGGMDMLLHRTFMHAMPLTIQIEPTNICNLQCPLCPTGGADAKREKGFMTYANFKKLLDEIGDTLVFAIMYGWGEPFLNRELPEMIAACAARGISTLTSTNGHVLQSPDEARRVVESGLTALIIAIDGSSQEIYQKYRLNGDVEKVKRCVSLIEEAKAALGKETPFTNLRLVATDDNTADIENVRSLAKELGVNMFSIKSLGCLPDKKAFVAYQPKDEGLLRFESLEKRNKQGGPVRCPYPFRQPTVFWDGELVGCEFDYNLDGPWGNVFRDGFADIWNAAKAISHRKSILSGLKRPEFCGACPYRGRTGNSSIISADKLNEVRRNFKEQV